MNASKIDMFMFQLEGVESALLNAEEMLNKLQVLQKDLLASDACVIDVDKVGISKNAQTVQGWINQIKAISKC